MDERRPLPESIRHRGDVDALLAASTNYEDRLPRDPLRKALDLERVSALLASIGDPQIGPQVVHIAGSKGKGSTARMVAAGLRHADSGRVGLYTSPHLQDLTERIDIDGRPIAEDALVAAANSVLPHVRATRGRPDAPTFFELFTAMAWHAFRASDCRHVVLETGLGGRLDATNVCEPAATVITSIEREHTRLLGETVEAIAAEKAGILKPAVPAICTARGAAAVVVEARAQEIDAPLWLLGRDFNLSDVQVRPGPQLAFVLHTPEGRTEQALLPLAGAHQAENAAAAWLALRLAGVESGPAWRGLGETQLPGLMEVVAHDPLVVIDGAHTARSAEAARETLAACWPNRRIVLVFALLEEKHVEEVAAPLLDAADSVIVTQVDSPRAIPANQLAGALTSAFPALAEAIRTEPRPFDALAHARRLAGAEGIVFCAGSIYLAGEVRTLVDSVGSGR